MLFIAIPAVGLNTAIGDAHNITWKLAAVLKGQASPSILKTYETERQPIGKRNTQWALFTFMNFRHLDTAVGLIPGPKELSPILTPINNALYQQLCSDTFDGEARRAAVEYAGMGQRVECACHDLEIGGVYSSGALSPDGTKPPAVDPHGQRYSSIARPGHRLPHAWLQGSKRVSTHHLLDDKGSWLLLTDDSSNGKKWLTIAADLESQRGLKMKAVQIGGGGEFKDENGQWLKASGLEASSGGVVIIRPDGYVAFRSRDFLDSTISTIGNVLGY
jgi:2,4-dichlorophenol 6-monooxygenase